MRYFGIQSMLYCAFEVCMEAVAVGRHEFPSKFYQPSGIKNPQRLSSFEGFYDSKNAPAMI
jgi:hypothetical protein